YGDADCAAVRMARGFHCNRAVGSCLACGVVVRRARAARAPDAAQKRQNRLAEYAGKALLAARREFRSGRRRPRSDALPEPTLSKPRDGPVTGAAGKNSLDSGADLGARLLLLGMG